MNQKHRLEQIGNTLIPTFPYVEYGIKGVGKNRHTIINMDQFINHSSDELLHLECCKGLALCNDYKMGMVYGALPPSEVARFNGHDSWSEIIVNLTENDPSGIHKQALEDVASRAEKGLEMQAIYKYAYFAMGAVIPWFFACYLKHNSFAGKTKSPGTWTDSAKYFPSVVEYIDTLPFKSVGRVLFFTTYPNAGVVIHRDSVVAEHSDHNINLFFNAGWRPSFIWDEIKKEKTFLPVGATSYFFNNRDYHGVDSEPVFRYTLRVDGVFTDELCEKLGLEDGYTWKWSYENT